MKVKVSNIFKKYFTIKDWQILTDSGGQPTHIKVYAVCQSEKSLSFVKRETVDGYQIITLVTWLMIRHRMAQLLTEGG